ncbi:MAG TPA: hypothetical protein VJ484_04280 [Lysobacter sp.]|nr:hypothetical protein [Lysobacter sp.]
MAMNAYRVSAVMLALAVAFLVASGMRQSRTRTTPAKALPAASSASAAATPTRITKADIVPRTEQFVVAFRLDPALTQGLYLGDRWVSPERYHFAQAGTRYVVQSKMQRIDTRGERKDLYGNWQASDLGMIDVIPADRGEVTLVINRPGVSTVTASAAGKSKVLRVRAVQVENGMQVEIVQ